MSETPDNLHRMQYSAHICEEILAWPSKGNAELIADCILSISKAKKLPIKKAHDYLVRAISLANQQGVAVDRMFFMNGEYTKMRPARDFHLDNPQKISAEEYKRIQADRKAFFSSPEYKEWLAKMTAKSAMPSNPRRVWAKEQLTKHLEQRHAEPADRVRESSHAKRGETAPGSES